MANVFKYDVFVSYDPSDDVWIKTTLYPYLHNAQISIIDQYEFQLGHPALHEVERAIQQSRRTLVVLTPKYLKNNWRHFDELLAQSYGLNVGEWRTIPIILKACQLPPRLNALVSLDLRNPEPEDWQRLLQTLQTKTNDIRFPRPKPPLQKRRPYKVVIASITVGFIMISILLTQAKGFLPSVSGALNATVKPTFTSGATTSVSLPATPSSATINPVSQSLPTATSSPTINPLSQVQADGYIYYGRRPKGKWTDRYFDKTTGNVDDVPVAGDAVIAKAAVNVRAGYIEYDSNDGWINKEIIGTVTPEDRIQVLEVKEIKDTIWIKFRKTR